MGVDGMNNADIFDEYFDDGKPKYIIQNCPAILRMTKICDAYETTRDLPQFCKDCTDCVMKQIVELCKDEQQSRVATNILSNKILKLLDIKEQTNE